MHSQYRCLLARSRVRNFLTSGKTPGTATVMATTGVSAAFLNVIFTPATGTIIGKVVDDSNNAIEGAIVAVG